MARRETDTRVVASTIVAWPAAILHLERLAARDYKLAAKAPTEFERGRLAGRAEMAEELQNLPEALAVLAEEDANAEGNGVRWRGQQEQGGSGGS